MYTFVILTLNSERVLFGSSGGDVLGSTLVDSGVRMLQRNNRDQIVLFSALFISFFPSFCTPFPLRNPS